MAQIQVREDVLAKLRGKTVIVTGGANGIGKAAVLRLAELGAKIVIGDLDAKSGESVLQTLGGAAVFQQTDVTRWESLQSLFDLARRKYGDIDAVFANAGLPEREPFLYEDKLDANGDLMEPDFRVIDVNLNGVLRTAKLALHHFAKNKSPGGVLVITGSAASYFPSAPIIRYGAAKHALLGFMRATAAMSSPRNVRVNVVAPWMTETDFSSEVTEIWGDLPKNTVKEVADALCVAAADETLHGRCLYVAKEIVDFELPLHETRESWMSPKQARWFEQGRRKLAEGMGLPGTHYLEGKH
ncbi:hypothetical protein MKZ38_001635 [Zalerion maritima]|uniref:Uncharacterized protein n=1 Tax=Zalerion maritima TaxID=339359 RepID=A0AAD5RQZ4_9PEZI|nr:hypothetical protein MKZ38_001635 [Zalerion maritima]